MTTAQVKVPAQARAILKARNQVREKELSQVEETYGAVAKKSVLYVSRLLIAHYVMDRALRKSNVPSEFAERMRDETGKLEALLLWEVFNNVVKPEERMDRDAATDLGKDKMELLPQTKLFNIAVEMTGHDLDALHEAAKAASEENSNEDPLGDIMQAAEAARTVH